MHKALQIPSKAGIKQFGESVLNSYSQIFFSDNLIFGFLLLLATFMFPFAGLAGLIGVLLANSLALHLGFDERKTIKGLWGYNVLLTTLPLGLFFDPSLAFWLLVVFVSLFTLLVTIAIQGILAKYELPFLSLPFVLVIWLIVLSSRQFEALQISGQSIYQLNELYGIGGTWLVGLYEWFQNLDIGDFLRAYFTSLSAIFFQNSLAGGLIIALGLIIASRISFLLSIIGFSAAFGFYQLMGMGISESDYSYIGFNFMLTAIAIGGFYNIPTKSSFLWVILLTPLVAIMTIGFGSILSQWHLSVYALPFNLTSILFIYVMKWRFTKGRDLHEVQVQRNSPEKNLYSFINYRSRFEENKPYQISLPFWGTWTVSQGHNGDITHRDEWRHAWDFVQTGSDGKTFRDSGTKLSDFYAFDKPVIAPVNGYVVEVHEGIPDNLVGAVNLKNNWGNTVIIKIDELFYAKLSHFKKDSIKVKKGDWVSKGQQLGTCGNSGRSPEPHLHFQLQSTPYVDSRTIEYPIAYYLTETPDGDQAKSFSIPLQGENVTNPNRIQTLDQLFNFIPGQRLKIFYSKNGDDQEIILEVKTTAFNDSYFECQACGSKAYYQRDEFGFYFVHFEGDRKSALYIFYLAFFHVPMFYGKNTVIQDQFPPNQIFSGSSLFIQDFLAPFAIYLNGEYSLVLPEKNDLFEEDNLLFKSSVSLSTFDRPVDEWKFNTEIDEQKLVLEGISLKNKFKLVWEKD